MVLCHLTLVAPVFVSHLLVIHYWEQKLVVKLWCLFGAARWELKVWGVIIWWCLVMVSCYCLSHLLSFVTNTRPARQLSIQWLMVCTCSVHGFPSCGGVCVRKQICFYFHILSPFLYCCMPSFPNFVLIPGLHTQMSPSSQQPLVKIHHSSFKMCDFLVSFSASGNKSSCHFLGLI